MDSPGLRFFPHLAIIMTCLKLLVMPGYKSTDFEVHRNWLAITYSLPPADWYYEKTSEWTLDYPPFFAYFEKMLSCIAVRIDPLSVRISSTPYTSDRFLYFHCLTVIVTDLVFYYATYCWLKFLTSGVPAAISFRQMFQSNLNVDHKEESANWFDPWLHTVVLLVLTPALFFVDHMHFQYNGFLCGIFMLSLLYIVQDNIITGSVLFTVLLNFKHIFLYVAPAFFVYILRRHCMDLHMNLKIKKFLTVGLSVLVIFSLSFLPFIHHLPQLKDRLFPFKRGLTHAYWAPNIWALYNFADLLLAKGLRMNASIPYTSGLVQEFNHVVLPSVKPAVTTILVIITMLPALSHVWKWCAFSPAPGLLFLQSVVVCSLSSFLCAWHVHEKAIIIAILPAVLLINRNASFAKIWILLSVSGTVSLLPLLIKSAETTIAIVFGTAYFVYAVPGSVRRFMSNRESDPVSLFEKVTLLIFPLHVLASQFYSRSELGIKYPFLPLAITSVLCATGIISSYLKLYKELLLSK